MAALSVSSYLLSVILLCFCLKSLDAVSDSSFSFSGFGKDPSFESNIALYGDAKVVDGASSIQLTGGANSSAGRIMYKKPIKLVGGKDRYWVSFSTYFSFSISPEDGDGLAFVMLPKGFNVGVFGNSSFGLSFELEQSKIRVVGVEFDTSRDVKYGDMNDNHVGIDVGSLVSVKATNVSSINLVLNSDQQLHSWIDYEAGSKRLEVRLSQSGRTRPVAPLLSSPIDLSKMWEDEEVFMGLSSSNKNSSQRCFVYSWSFTLKRIPQWMHSQPVDPKSFNETKKPETAEKRSNCLLRTLAGVFFGAGCGALGTLVVLYLWSICGKRRPVVPEKYAVHPVDFDYRKVEVVVVDKAIEDGKK